MEANGGERSDAPRSGHREADGRSFTALARAIALVLSARGLSSRRVRRKLIRAHAGVTLETHGDEVALGTHGETEVLEAHGETEKVSPVRSTVCPIANGKASAPHDAEVESHGLPKAKPVG